MPGLFGAERWIAFLDDLHVVNKSCGKNQVWNSGGVLERIAQEADPQARVWRGSDLPTK